MNFNEAAALAKAAEDVADIVESLQARVSRLENAVCIVVSDETLPMDTRMDVASAMLPSLDQAA
jgi:hypothetical protein